MADVVARHAYLLPRAVAKDEEVFAVGDIHGRADLLQALLDEATREPQLREKRVIVFLGDLIDRGPDSFGAVDLAIGAGERIGASTVPLMGNHEAMLRLAVDPETPPDGALFALDLWLRNGGVAVLRQCPGLKVPPRRLDELLTTVRAALPERVRAWLAGLKTHWFSGSVLFVHAGVNPRMRLEAFLATPWNAPLDLVEENEHWAWVRWPFLEFETGPQGFSGYFVVHGHTPNDAHVAPTHEDQIARFRLNLDAGSGRTGVAKMGIFRGAEATVLTATGPADISRDGR